MYLYKYIKQKNLGSHYYPSSLQRFYVSMIIMCINMRYFQLRCVVLVDNGPNGPKYVENIKHKMLWYTILVQNRRTLITEQLSLKFLLWNLGLVYFSLRFFHDPFCLQLTKYSQHLRRRRSATQEYGNTPQEFGTSLTLMKNMGKAKRHFKSSSFVW
jgi:hypothetical protein